MPATPVVDGLLMVPLGPSNAYLIDAGEGTVMVDAGPAGRHDRLVEAVRSLGKDPGAVTDILITHYHGDHVGDLAAVARETGASVHVHSGDAKVVREGLLPPSGSPANLLARLLLLVFRPGPSDPAQVDHELIDGQHLPLAGGIAVVHTPGHTSGHVSFLWNGVLLAGDAAANQLGRLGRPLVAEDWAAAGRNVARIAQLDFDTAVFGHGRPIVGGAAERFRRWLA